MEREAELKKITTQYKTLKDQEFTGVYSGVWIEPSDFGQGKTWHTIEPAVGDPIRSKLAAIQQVAQGKVWKGFTTDRDRKSRSQPPWNDRFFVNLDFAGIQSPTKFKLTGCKQFIIPKFNVEYTLGVGFALTVRAIPPPPIV